ncbi:MAG: hypothetical protein IPN90_09010 [Elusimicrobia bacterium]|nr:hypothetical protein [Elusimicrobiota bacterium]
MDPTVKDILKTLIVSVLYLLLFVVTLPLLLRVLDQTAWKFVFGGLVFCGVGLAIRLRQLSRRL